MKIEYLSFVETKVFTRQIDRLASLSILFALQNELLENPRRGDVIPNAKGARKARIGSLTKGKRGGFRYIYLYIEEFGVIYLLLFYGKNERDTLDPNQTKQLAQLAAQIRSNYTRRAKRL